MSLRYLHFARRALGRPPGFVARRAFQEVRLESERFLAPRRARQFGIHQLLRQTGASSIEELWGRLADQPYVAHTKPIPRNVYDSICPNDADRIIEAAERALAHRVNFLGSGDVDLGASIDWHKDYKSSFRWPPQYCRDIDIMNPGRPSDVKFPWELSRLQWLIPAGQAYLLGAGEKYAEGARRILDDWIESNPLAGSVNWSCAMEAAMRIMVWTWLFHAFATSTAWKNDGFRARFLCSLYLHADFTDRHFEFSDVNANHCDADAAGLVFAGLFFGSQGQPGRWLERGWGVLNEEFPKQVSGDGVDYEASVPYHRLVTELFFLSALYQSRLGLPVPVDYRDRVEKMAWFSEAYTRPDGSVPCLGDADDARTLPFGGQAINDHRYLLGCIGVGFGYSELSKQFSGDLAECVWLLGPDSVKSLAQRNPAGRRSKLFREGGYAILRNDRDHVFVDCAPVGMGGRGGHGHNDILSCEVVLDGRHLVADSGSFVYTADYAAHHRFRSTASHNTPRVDREEVNRFVRPDQELWWLRNDAKPEMKKYESGPQQDILVVAHSGYQRLAKPVTPVRTYVLDHESHALTIKDEFEGFGDHLIEIPLHLALGVVAQITSSGVALQAGGDSFLLEVLSPGWNLLLEPAEFSPSYGVRHQTSRLLWSSSGPMRELIVKLSPQRSCTEELKD